MTFPYEYTDDPCQERALMLQAALGDRGITSEVHWDRSPWGVRIRLVPDRPPWDDPDYAAVPHLYVLTEGKRDLVTDRTRPWLAPDLAWQWSLSLGGFAEDVDGVLDGFTGWLREWNNGVDDVADVLRVLVPILREGARAEVPDA